MSAIPLALPRRLAAPEPGWTLETDVVIIGSGIAGLTTALRYIHHNPDGRVVLVTKERLDNGSTRWAQGGIAAAVDPSDRPVAHMVDTLVAGAGMSDPLAVHYLAAEGPAALHRLIELGAAFDREDDGGLALTREGGHRSNRVAHAGGDATGAEIQRALIGAVRAQPRIEIIEHALALDPLPARREGDGGAPGAVCGVTLHVMDEGKRHGVGAVHAPAVVLATGGLGQVFSATTNPDVSTGDGVALAARAGAHIADIEFIQFHPTVLWSGSRARGQQQLISEAVRGEGAFLVDTAGNRFMRGVHELGDLAPRDVVTREIARAMGDTGAEYVYLDARHFGERKWRQRFPTILAGCYERGIDPVNEPLPVVPAAHYASGGVEVDMTGRSSLEGLFAVGEVARTGVHGANRLASNSLLEGLVFAERIAEHLARELPRRRSPDTDGAARPGIVTAEGLDRIREVMSQHAGVLRDIAGLREAAGRIAALAERYGESDGPGVADWEATNLATVAALVVTAASRREESRGAHYRVDAPRTSPRWRGRSVRMALVEGEVRSTEVDRGVALPDRLRAELDAVGAPVAREPYERGRPDLVSRVGAPHEDHVAIALRALAEDMTAGERIDVTSVATMEDHRLCTADVVARADGVVSGLAMAELVFWIVAEGGCEIERHACDGNEVKRGDTLMTVTARARDVLTAERTALNFLTHLSGIATATRAWSEAVAGTSAEIRDTRKTHVGLRALEKYAVRCGGGVNHRFGLGDAALVKDNHVVAAGGVGEAVRAVREAFPDLSLEVEVDRVEQIPPALEAGATELLLDNFTVAQLREAVALVRGRARLEASGGLTLDTAREVAATGVDYLAVGALTHSSPALDIALDMR